MPTALERGGDFSQTFDSQGRCVWIRDPLLAAQGLACNVNSGGPGCFPGNKIPANRINAIGPADAEPVPAAERDRSRPAAASTTTPTRTCSRSRATTRWRASTTTSRRNTTFYTRVQFGNEVNSRGANAFLGAGTGNGGNAGWPQFNTSYEVGIGQPGEHAAAHVQLHRRWPR